VIPERPCGIQFFAHDPHDWTSRDGVMHCPGVHHEDDHPWQHNLAFALVAVAILSGMFILWKL
jgi:hypothetical protein